MTAPIQEPNNERALQGLAYARDQIFRRPPVGSCRWCSTSCYFDTLTANGTGFSVADDSWEEVVTGLNGPNDRWFEQFCMDPDGEWGRDFGAGTIENTATVAYTYSAFGWVRFDVPDGSKIGVQFSWLEGSNTMEVLDGADSIAVYGERVPISPGGVSLRCYQQSGGAADILAAYFAVRRFEVFEDVFDCEFANS